MRRLAYLAAAAALLIAACSSDTTRTSDTSPSTSPSTSPASAPTTEASPTTDAAADTTQPAPETTVTTVASTADATVDTVADTTVPTPTGPLTVQQLLDLGRPIVLAHGGGEDQHPHSTPYSYGESVRAGVDMLDFDVQLTADGVLVVQHDDDTGRTTDQNLVVADTDYATLAALDNAYWFTATCTCTDQPPAAYTLRGIRTGAVPPPAGYTADDFVIPRFEDIVQRYPDMPLNIEIKGNGASAIAAATELARILTDNDRLDSSVVASFDDLVVEAFHELAPTVEVTPGLSAASAWFLNDTPLPTGMRILQVPPEYGDIEVLTADSIRASHDAGYVIWIWPNDRDYENPASYARFLDEGLDGLNINFPDDGVAAVRAFSS